MDSILSSIQDRFRVHSLATAIVTLDRIIIFVDVYHIESPGCAGVFVGHPLDTVKVCLQTQDSKTPKYQNTAHCLKSIFEANGFKGIYRGVTSPLFGVAGINAIVFGIYGNSQRCMQNPDSLASHAFAGAIAGFMQSFICSPMELVKSTMQVGNNSIKSPLDCLKNIYKKNGIKGVFRGLSLTISREVPSFSAYFVTYEFITRRNDDLPVSTVAMLMGGGLAGVVSWALPYPIDVLKSRYQVDGITSTKYSNAYDCLVKSVQSEGVGCLYRGITPTLIRAFPVNAVTFTVVMWTMRIANELNFSTITTSTEVLLTKYENTIIHNSLEQVIYLF